MQWGNTKVSIILQPTQYTIDVTRIPVSGLAKHIVADVSV